MPFLAVHGFLWITKIFSRGDFDNVVIGRYDCGTMLEVKNLRAQVAGKEILKGVDMAVGAGGIHFIMGPNGSGKTTFAHALMGHPLVSVSEGVMKFFGEDIRADPPEARAKKGLHLGFQHPVEVPGVGMTAFLRAVLAARGGEPPRADEFRAALVSLAEQTKMSHALLDRNLNEGFSGGEKKRSEIFQMRVLEPKLAILDEFDSGLDVDGIRAAAASLKKWMNPVRSQTPEVSAIPLKAGGTSNGMNPERALIVITHTGRVSEFLRPDTVHIMKDGIIVRRGGPELVREIEKRGFESSASV